MESDGVCAAANISLSFMHFDLTKGSNSRECSADWLNKQYEYEYENETSTIA